LSENREAWQRIQALEYQVRQLAYVLGLIKQQKLLTVAQQHIDGIAELARVMCAMEEEALTEAEKARLKQRREFDAECAKFEARRNRDRGTGPFGAVWTGD
jgi:hypothetical protein